MNDNPYTAVIEEYMRGVDKVTFVTFDRATMTETPYVVTHIAHYDGKVRWADDWTRLDDLEPAGVHRVHKNGHGDPYAQTTEYFYI